jgi:hypothetical protein
MVVPIAFPEYSHSQRKKGRLKGPPIPPYEPKAVKNDLKNSHAYTNTKEQIRNHWTVNTVDLSTS